MFTMVCITINSLISGGDTMLERVQRIIKRKSDIIESALCYEEYCNSIGKDIYKYDYILGDFIGYESIVKEQELYNFFSTFTEEEIETILCIMYYGRERYEGRINNCVSTLREIIKVYENNYFLGYSIEDNINQIIEKGPVIGQYFKEGFKFMSIYVPLIMETFYG